MNREERIEKEMIGQLLLSSDSNLASWMINFFLMMSLGFAVFSFRSKTYDILYWMGLLIMLSAISMGIFNLIKYSKRINEIEKQGYIETKVGKDIFPIYITVLVVLCLLIITLLFDFQKK